MSNTLDERAAVIHFLRQESARIQDPQIAELIQIFIHHIELGKHRYFEHSGPKFCAPPIHPVLIDNPLRDGQGSSHQSLPLPASHTIYQDGVSISAYPESGAIPATAEPSDAEAAQPRPTRGQA